MKKFFNELKKWSGFISMHHYCSYNSRCQVGIFILVASYKKFCSTTGYILYEPDINGI